MSLSAGGLYVGGLIGGEIPYQVIKNNQIFSISVP